MKFAYPVLFFACIFGLIYENDALWRKPKVKVDCTYTFWGVWGACVKKSGLYITGSKYTRVRHRYLVQPKNGGKSCPDNPILVDRKDCNSIEYMANLMMTSIYSNKNPDGAGGGSTHQAKVMGFAVQTLDTGDDDDDKPCHQYKDEDVMAFSSCKTTKKQNTRKKRQAPVAAKHRDFLFLVDGSGSVTKKYFEYEKRVAAAIVNGFTGSIRVKQDLTRVAMMTFDNLNRPQFNFNDFYVKQTLMDEIKKVKFFGGGTCMSKALTYCKDHMFVKSRGARVTPPVSDTVEKVIFMITDGCANCATPAVLETVRSTLETDDISVFTLHIGNVENCRKSLQALSDGTRCFQMFNVKNWADLEQLAIALEDGTLTFDSWEEFKQAGNWQCTPLEDRTFN